MSQLNEITAIYQSLAHLLKRIELLYKRGSKLEQESKEKDKLIERLNKENDYLMKENIDVIKTPIVEGTEDKMTKTIYILTATDDQDKVIVGVFEAIELASFAKEQWDREAYWDKEKATIEEHALNYDWNLEKFLDQSDKPVNVIDPSTLSLRWHGVE
jgi:hypothetical protein